MPLENRALQSPLQFDRFPLMGHLKITGNVQWECIKLIEVQLSTLVTKELFVKSKELVHSAIILPIRKTSSGVSLGS